MEHSQTGNHLFSCAAAMTAMLMLDLPQLKEKTEFDFSTDESLPHSGSWFSTVLVHGVSTTQAARGGQLHIYLPLSTRCTALSKEKIEI